jgi:hypothetical protein
MQGQRQRQYALTKLCTEGYVRLRILAFVFGPKGSSSNSVHTYRDRKEEQIINVI